MKNGLRIEELCVGYDGKRLISDICLHVLPGHIMTLIGPNGAGKSTVLKTITGHLKPVCGTIYLNEKPENKMSNEEIAKSLSMVMTKKIRTEWMTCRDVVETGRYPYTGFMGNLSKEDEEKVKEALALVHADEVAEADFQKISDGQRQRIMLARALCQEPEVLVLDEPTSYLDLHYKLDILSLIRKMVRDKKIAVIMSLHELDFARKVSDYIVGVAGNQICFSGTPEEVFVDKRIEELYGLSKASYDSTLGIAEFPAIMGKPELFVIGGAGMGIPLYYRLQRKGIPFAAGILQENDLEYKIAKSLAVEVISTKAFYPIGQKQIDTAKRAIRESKHCICTIKEFGPLNDACKELFLYAKELGKIEVIN